MSFGSESSAIAFQQRARNPAVITNLRNRILGLRVFSRRNRHPRYFETVSNSFKNLLILSFFYSYRVYIYIYSENGFHFFADRNISSARGSLSRVRNSPQNSVTSLKHRYSSSAVNRIGGGGGLDSSLRTADLSKLPLLLRYSGSPDIASPPVLRDWLFKL